MTTQHEAFWVGVGSTLGALIVVAFIGTAVSGSVRGARQARERVEAREQWQSTAIRALLNDDVANGRRFDELFRGAQTQHANLMKLWDLHNALERRVQQLEKPVTGGPINPWQGFTNWITTNATIQVQVNGVTQ